MTRDELLARLIEIRGPESTHYPGVWIHDDEIAHSEADKALIEYINDPEIAKFYDDIGKWHA